MIIKDNMLKSIHLSMTVNKEIKCFYPKPCSKLPGVPPEMMSETTPSRPAELHSTPPRNLRSLSRLEISEDVRNFHAKALFHFPQPDFCIHDSGESEGTGSEYSSLLSSLGSSVASPGHPPAASSATSKVTLMLSCRNSYVTESDETISEVQIAGSPVQRVSNFPLEGGEDGEVQNKVRMRVKSKGGGRAICELRREKMLRQLTSPYLPPPPLSRAYLTSGVRRRRRLATLCQTETSRLPCL